MIYLVRKMTKNFITLNPEATINDFPFNLLGMAEDMEIDEYIEKYVM